MPLRFGTAVILGSLLLSGCSDGETPPVSSADSLEALRSLPYAALASSVKDDSACGVVSSDPDRYMDGYNVFQDYGKRVFLMDMEGRIVHSWELGPEIGPIEYAQMTGEGDVVTISTNRLGRHRWDSRELLRRPGPYHHDFELLDDGTYLALSAERHDYNGYRVQFDRVDRIASDGTLLGTWSTHDHHDELRAHHLPSPLDRPGGTPNEYDYYHLNTIRSLPETPLTTDRRFRKGNWLLCSRHTNLIFIVDSESGEVTWSWGTEELQGPHDPRMLDDGSILIFDNGSARGHSRLLRVDPRSNEIVWRYRADPPEDFYSNIRGASQPLDNGNILVTESERARAFEITPDGEIVWDYHHPFLVDGKRRSIFRMLRHPRVRIERLLETLTPTPPDLGSHECGDEKLRFRR